ncbi:matrix metalloproteinase-18-like [Patiria miniata]|uniref:Peptidase metallopeptidase domain-containing protein n=1 Tax=Patiria miniata TaxID=46514 RepID=A0A913ZUY1_PATMI|nr:matrix metalloproteinase-18-like [Patiria miniata]
MRVLSLYGVLVIALLVCCLAPGDVLSKPLKKKRGRHGHHDGDNGRDHPRGRPGKHGKGRGETTEPPQEDDGSGDDEHADSGEAAGNRTRGRPGMWSIRPRYVPGEDKRKGKGPLGLEETPEGVKRNNMKKAMGYMSKYGYMGDMDEDDWNTDSVSDKQMKKSIKMMQKFMGLKATGELDEMTMMMMDKPRCGLPDVPPSSATPNDTQTGPLSYNHFGRRWGKQEITFRILNYPSTMPSSEAREALIRAFLVWSDVTPLTFRETGRTVPEYADFYIKFGTRSHGDAYPFDGRGGVLAHAFLPGTNSGDIEGDVHFDDEELFTYASYSGTNLFQVAAHEIGHSLGLTHSNDPTALMAPFYPGWQPTFYLPYDDIAGIQSLYGSNPSPRPYPNPYPNPEMSQPTNPPTTTTTPPNVPPSTTPTSGPNPNPTGAPAPTPDPCSPLIGATTVWRSEFFAFTGDKYGRIRDYQILSQNGGSTASYFFQNFPRDIDALYESPVNYKLYMFKGPSYYVYEGLMQESGPLPITDLDPSLPSDIDAVVSWATTSKTYFFKNDQVWRFDEANQTVDSGWPNPISQVWVGLPNDVTAAWHDEEQFLTYFMIGSDYYRYDDLYAEVEVDLYPRNFISDYFGCF